MILKIVGLVSVLVGIQGASYSKVYVQSGGSDAVPIEYGNFGGPAVVAEPQIARLSAAPVGPVVSVPSAPSVIPPCVSPCIIGQNVAPVASMPTAKFITYTAPKVPVILAPSKDNGYEYSYVVYDENTGDRKAQREFSDGAVVRGEYSFVQPDGYVREVQYRADDLTGFNVVIKNVLPEFGVVDKNDQPPRKDVKSEALIEAPSLELGEPAPIDHNSPGHDCHDHDGDGVEDHASNDHVEPAPEVTIVTPVVEEQTQENTPNPVQTPNESDSIVTEPTTSASEPTTQPQEESYQAIVVPEEPAPEVLPLPVPAPTVPVPVPSLPLPVSALPVPFPGLPGANFVVSYEDLIRCFQSKVQASRGSNVSPLTYILLPAANRPC